VRIGTNQALMIGIIHALFTQGWIDERYVRNHTIGVEELERVTAGYAPERVAEICDVPASQVEAAAELVGRCHRLLSTVLQGFYQSNQATAAARQVNNVHLLRACSGGPAPASYRMNGQPTAQNTRKTGADGDLPGLRNWNNPEHIRQLAELWTSTRSRSPTGPNRPTRCRSSATRNRARSSCCGSRRPTRSSRCPTSPAFGASWRKRTSS
jgi:anaerobic selenocysteine-containing dehydrogenase